MLILVAVRQVQIFLRRLLRFLDESMQQNHPAFLVDIKEHPRDSVLGQARPHFVDTVAQWPPNGHPYWPAELHRLDILADVLPIFRRKLF